MPTLENNNAIKPNRGKHQTHDHHLDQILPVSPTRTPGSRKRPPQASWDTPSSGPARSPPTTTKNLREPDRWAPPQPSLLEKWRPNGAPGRASVEEAAILQKLLGAQHLTEKLPPADGSLVLKNTNKTRKRHSMCVVVLHQTVISF